MGFWSKLFGGKDAAEESASAGREGFPLDSWYTLDDEKKYAELERFLTCVGEPFADVKVVRRTNDEQVELRAKVEGFPLRLRLDRDVPHSRDLVLKHKSPLGFIDLDCDPEKKPEGEVAPDEAFGDEHEEKRIFVGRAVYFEGSDAEKEAANFERLPQDFRERLIDTMLQDGVMYFRIRPEEVDVTLRIEPYEMPTPVTSLRRIIALMGASAKAVGAATPAPKKAKPNVVRCSYCSAQQLISETGRCCNCGAPFSD